MKARQRPRFDIDALRELAGAKVFTRGEAYHRDGKVALLSVKPTRVLARVEGTEDYRTELRGVGKNIDGHCSCRAFEDWGFCKHMVATALAANDLPAGGDEGLGALDRIRHHLKEKSVDALIDIIVDVAEQDPVLFRKLDTAAAVMREDDKTVLARLRKMIDSATRTGSSVDYDEVACWAAGVDAVLDGIAGLASGARAGLAIELAGHAFDRIEKAMDRIDDSDGHCGSLLGRVRDIHLAAVREVRPESVGLARDLFALEMADGYGTFEQAMEVYADMLGEPGLAEYRRLAREAWEKIPPYAAGPIKPQVEDEDDDEFAGDQHRLLRILDAFAERAGEIDIRIALRERHLSSQGSYLQLAQFCLSHGREEEALRRAEEGLWMFEDGLPDQLLVLFAAELLFKAGRTQEAEKHLQRAFEKSPSLRLYNCLRESGGEAARERIVRFLEAKLAAGQKIRWHDPGDLLIRIWMQEKMFDAAWALVRKHGASPALEAQLATDSEATHPAEALEVHAARVEHLAKTGGDAAYAEAAKLVARMAKLRPRGEHVAYVLSLKKRFGRRQNFMKLLE